MTADWEMLLSQGSARLFIRRVRCVWIKVVGGD